jgi:two-component system phosphate regulon sensor histidine kinase PhoR
MPVHADSSSADKPRRPRRVGLFWKLLLSFAAISLAAILALAWIFTSAYETLLEREMNARLRTAATSVAHLMAEAWPAEPNDAAQSLARRIGRQTGVRLTLIGLDGRVLADSHEPDLAAVQSLENHHNRPEFAAAVRHGAAIAQRISPSLGERFHYFAVRVDDEGRPVGVARTALSAAPIDAEIDDLHRWITIIASLVAAAAMAVAYWVARRLTDPLRALAATAAGLVAGQYERRIAVPSGGLDEVGVLAGALNDIGQRLAQRERQLRSTSQTQATVLEGMTESVIAVDRQEKILFANACAGRVLGFDPKRVEGLTLLEAVRSHEIRDVMRRAIGARQPATGELTWRGKSQRIFDVLAAPLPGDPPPGIVLVLRDISELKRVEQMRQQFIANVSHELKTPLSSIKAYTETLLAGALNDPQHAERFLQRIDEQAGRLHQLILDMLTLARIESREAALELADVPVARVIRRCLADYEPQAAAREVTLADSACDDSLLVRADEEALRQILGNLVDNAIKYTPAAGRVSVSCRADGASAVIEVADTGAGIPPEHHARLFERFYRVDKARSRELGGTGLGLAIVKHLCQAMGGSVSVTSQVGKGSVFAVRLPRERDKSPALAPREN